MRQLLALLMMVDGNLQGRSHGAEHLIECRSIVPVDSPNDVGWIKSYTK